MVENVLFSDDQMDYLVELLNIGAGNAATALTNLLGCEVKMALPGLDVLPAPQVPAAIGSAALPVVCVRMKMVGEVKGCLFFVIPDDQKAKLAHLAEQAQLGRDWVASETDHVQTTLTEIANILAGVYLTAIHDFCGLSVCHSVPVLAIDLMQALLDAALATRPADDRTIILIKNEFLIGVDSAQTFFLIVPTAEGLGDLVGSMREAGKLLGGE